MRIMPSGNGSMDWLPKNLVKTASSEGVVEEEQDRDDLLEAAKAVVATEAEGGSCETVVGGDELTEDDSVTFEGEPEEVSEEEEVEIETEEPEAEAVECLEKAKDAIEEAVECLSDEAEVEVEIEEDEEETNVDEVSFEEPEEVDVVVEGGVNCLAEEKTKEASTDNWVKVSAISPSNRKKVLDYWVNKLGYPKDFVKLMVKDYEK